MSNDEASSTRWTTILGIVLVLGVYTFPLAGKLPARNPNELSRIELGVSMALLGTISIDEAARVYLFPQDSARRDGKSYSDKAPGLSLLCVPFIGALSPLLPREGDSRLPDYWWLRHLLTWFLVAVPGAVAPFLLLRSYAPVDRRLRAPIAIVFAVSTPMLVYSTVFFGHIPAAVLTAAGYCLALRPGRPDETPSRGACLATGLCLGLAIATEYPVVVIVVVVLAAMLARRHPWRRLALIVAGVIVALVPTLLYHHGAFGSFWSTGYGFKTDVEDAAIHAEGMAGITLPTIESLLGVLVSPRRGILYFCPLLLLVPVGLRLLHAKARRDVWPLVATLGLYVAFASGFVDWEAGWSAAARHLTPALLLSVFPVALAVQELCRLSWGRFVVAILAAASLCGSILSVAVTPFFPESFVAPLGQLVLRSLSDGVALPSLLSEATPLTPLSSFLLFALGVLGLTVAALDSIVRSSPGRPWIAVVFIASIAASVWTISVMTPPRSSRSEVHRALILQRLGYEERALAIVRGLRANGSGDGS